MPSEWVGFDVSQNNARELDGKPNGKPINYTNMVTRHFRPALLAMVAKNLDTGRAAKNLEEGNVSLPLAGHALSRRGEDSYYRDPQL